MILLFVGVFLFGRMVLEHTAFWVWNAYFARFSGVSCQGWGKGLATFPASLRHSKSPRDICTGLYLAIPKHL